MIFYVSSSLVRSAHLELQTTLVITDEGMLATVPVPVDLSGVPGGEYYAVAGPVSQTERCPSIRMAAYHAAGPAVCQRAVDVQRSLYDRVDLALQLLGTGTGNNEWTVRYRVPVPVRCLQAGFFIIILLNKNVI